MYKRELRERQTLLREQAEQKTVSFSKKIDRPVQKVTESRKAMNPVIAAGLEGLQD